MKTGQRLWLTSCVLVIVHGVVLWVQQGSLPAEFILPKRGLAIPTEIGHWKSEEISVDPKVVGTLDTEMAVNRRYIDPEGNEVYLHVAAWSEAFVGPPHKPEVCYPAGGWQIVKHQSGTLSAPAGSAIRITILDLEQNGAAAQALYWYQLGEHGFSEKDGLRKAYTAHWGQQRWPCIVKVLLHVNTTRRQSSEKLLRSFAAELAPTICGLY